jgi:hypothetical protein
MSNIGGVEIDEFHMDRQILSYRQCVESWGEEVGGKIWNKFIRDMKEYSNEFIHKIDNDGQS